MATMSSPDVSRRGLFGYASAAGIGGAAGIVAGRTTATASEESRPASTIVGLTHSPYGEHQAGIFTPKPAVGELVAFDLLPSTDKAALGRLMRVWSADVAAYTEGRSAAGDFAPDMAQAGVSFTALICASER